MSNNLTATIGGGRNREAQQIQAINIKNKTDNSNNYNTFYWVKAYLIL